MSDAGQTGAPAAGQQAGAPAAGQQGAEAQQGQQTDQAGATATIMTPGGQQSAPAPQVGAQAQQGQQGQAPQGGLDWSAVPAEYRAAFEQQSNRNYELQRERGNERVAAKETARNEGALTAVRDLAKSLGLELPGDEVTVEGVQAELGETVKARDTALRAAAITEAAYTSEVDPAKRAYVEFLLSKDTSLPAPTDGEFSGKVSSAVAALVAADPTLRRSGTVQAAGVENHGGATGSDDITPEQFAAMSMGQKTALYRDNPDTYTRLSGRA